MSDLGIPDQVIANVMKDWGIGDGTAPAEDAATDVPVGEDAADTSAADYDPLSELGAELDAIGSETPPEAEPSGEAGEEDPAPPAPPGGPLWADDTGGSPAGEPAPAVTLPNGTVLGAEQLAALADLDTRLRAGQVPWMPQGQPPAPPPTVEKPPLPPQLPPPPRLTEEDLEDPKAVAQAMLWLAQKQQAETAYLKAQLEQTNAQITRQHFDESAQVTSSVTSLYKQRYNLPDEVMEKIVATAAPISAPLFQMYMSGTDPRTGARVAPDAAKAVETVLDMAYWNTPEARRFEIERQNAHQAKVRERKNKLGGVGGSSGSAPRQPKPVDLSNEAERHQAMIEAVEAAMGSDQ